MKTNDLVQGSPQWLAYRAQHFNASDAPAMLGCSPYTTRADLLRQMHTGVPADVDVGTQMRYDNGHRAEALARPLAEEFIGAELYPVTGSLDRLSASFDGLTLEEDECFEHKALNGDLRKAFERIAAISDELTACRELPLHHRVQMEQQLHISGAKRCMFMASKWTAEGELVEEQHCWYYPDEALRSQILSGWAQFERDLASFAMPESAPAAPVGKAPNLLPALRIEVTGEVTASNLAEFKQTALSAIRSVNRQLSTDTDFADAAMAVKWCADVESRLEAAKEHALSQTASIDALFKTMNDISSEARTVRLELGKLVDRRKVEVKESAVLKARRALDAHIAGLNAEIAPMQLRPVVADFAGAIKGLRSIASMQDALDTTLANAKIEADTAAREIRKNILVFQANATGLEFLFADLSQLVHRPSIDFGALVQGRIDAHKVAEAERERKRVEAERLAEERRKAVAAEAAQRVVDAASQQAAPIVSPAPAPVPVSTPIVSPPAAIVPPPRADEQATLKLGEICARLSFTMTAAFVADVLGVKPARTDGASRLYRPSDFLRICAALRSHVAAMAELYTPETV